MNLFKNWTKLFIILFIFIALIITLFFQSHKANFYANMGVFQIKKNNYSKAQEYFEKSYDLGNKDTDFRNIYVNSLVNSPLSIQAQEQLIKIAQDEIEDSASDSAEYFLRNLKKEIHNKYPNNYIIQAPYNQKVIHWGKLPITYTFRNTKKVPTEFVNAVNEAFNTWERASSARIRFDKISSSQADIVIQYSAKMNKNIEFGQKYVIASTTPIIHNNKLIKMEMELNIFNQDGKLFTPNQIYNTALHEIFHALGFMGHSFEKDTIMYMTQDMEIFNNNEKKTLSDSDKLTLELLYKIKPDITNAEELKYKYIPYLILGDNKEVNDAKAEEAMHYIKKAPNLPAGYIDYAQTLLINKKYRQSISYLERAFRLSSDKDEIYTILYNLAVANYYDGNYELAHIYIEKAKEYNIDNELNVLDAQIYVKEKELSKAIKIYEELISKNPNNIEFAVSLANIHINNKEYLKARKVLKNYISRNPKDANSSELKQYKILLIF